MPYTAKPEAGVRRRSRRHRPGWRLAAALCLAAAAVSCGSSAKPANRGSGNGGNNFTNRPGANAPANAGNAPTSSTGTNDQGNSGK